MVIGLFDSGAGGLTVLDALRKRHPECDFIYLADTAHFPYGEKTADEIRAHAEKAIAFLIEKGADQIVVACNTASAYITEGDCSVPLIRIIEPTARACAPFQRVGVIGTSSTINSGVYQKALGERCAIALPCPRLVQLAEAGEWDDEIANQELGPLIGKIDALLLGCTHYSILRDQIQAVVGGVAVIGAEGVEIASPQAGSGTLTTYTSGAYSP